MILTPNETSPSLLDDLRAKLRDLANLFQHPDLLLSEYFDNLRREIDLEAETCILELYKHTEKSGHIDRINEVRELLIAELNSSASQMS